MEYYVWGFIHGNTSKIKLYSGSLKSCKIWKRNNEKYYDDMNIYRRGHKPFGRLENTMSRWSKKELEQLDNITFAIAILNERRQSTTNPYSLLNQKLSEAVRELEHIKEQRIAESFHNNNGIAISDIVKILDMTHSRYEFTPDGAITYYYEKNSTDRTRIEIGDDGNSISIEGRIIGGLIDLKEWIYRGM